MSALVQYILNSVGRKKCSKAILISLTIGAFFCQTLYGQAVEAPDCHFHVHGMVFDQAGRQPIFGATVYVKELGKGAATDQTGDYMIEDICAGEYTLVCSYLGYQTDTVVVRLTPKQTFVEKNFTLQEQNIELNTITVRDRRVELSPTQSIAALQGADLDRTLGQSLGESLKSITGVNSIQTGPSISKPVIHGLHSNRILILNNGVRQEGQQWGSEHAPEIDPFIAQKISVIKGAASVRYGPDAIGGTVLIEPADLPYTPEISGEVNVVGATNNRQGVVSGIVQGGLKSNDAWSWRLQGTAKRGGNARTASYYLKNTGVSELNFSSAIGYRKEKYGAELFYSQFNTKIGIFAGSHNENATDFNRAMASERPLPEFESGFSYVIGRPYQDISHYLLKAKAYIQSNELGRFNFILAHQYNYRAEFDSHRPRGITTDAPELRFLLNTFTSDITWEHKPIKQLLTGTAGISSLYQSNDMQGRFLVPDFTNKGVGAFAIERFTQDRWEAEVGARYDVRALAIDPSQIRFETDAHRLYHNFSGTLGLTYRFTPAFLLKANAGIGWRPPAVNELFSNGVHHGDAVFERGDPNLEAETAYNFTTSLSYKGEKLQAEADGYHYIYNQYIYRQPQFPPVLTIRGFFPLFAYTQKDALLSGIDAAVSYRILPAISWKTKYSMVRARGREDGEYLPLFPADRLENILSYQVDKWKGLSDLYFSVSHLYVAKQWRIMPESDYKLPPPAYALLNADLGFSVPSLKGINVGVTVFNILNTSYRDYLNRFRYFADDIGRNISFRIKFQF